ncbi:molybdate ABC transporter substrate-binding protein [Agarivorans gilvus]|uniref:Molybdate-binding periplasmic protein ModA n=1 Tax=Agarivorans gilvus TaxID=680279 RepID=A0ABQ1I5E4_9ALTE|nr:molybdate ABC transporter substrate-binding protein [Agarivorans gilvus]GGB18076.1 molybdate-binding periplasmic protein ModA [Agarivorans gilvus]
MIKCNFKALLVGVTALSAYFSFSCAADTVQVAVAANFYQPLQQIAQLFEQDTQHKMQISVGSTGKLYAQIINGAPFEVFFAADQARPSLLVKQQLALAESQRSYAQGQLVLWSPNASLVDQQGKVLSSNTFRHLGICNPKTAPYGAAAVEALEQLGLYSKVQNKLVEGQSVAQTFQQISSGAVELGFVALSQVLVDGEISQGAAWLVPGQLYSPIKQDVVLLTKGKDNPAALALMAYLQTDSTQELIRAAGYSIP